MNLTEHTFTSAGGQFLTPFNEIKRKSVEIKLLVFDWDGVFNDGFKVIDQSSSFSEIDSMGTNMLRFSYWLKSGSIPLTAIITGANNNMAEYLTRRECFNYLFLKNKNKLDSINLICREHNINYNNIAFFFDDILDLDVARVAGIRMMVRRPSGLLFEQYVKAKELADYITGNQGNNGAVREMADLLVALNQNYEEVIEKRLEYSGDYARYLEQRNATSPVIIVDNNRDI